MIIPDSESFDKSPAFFRYPALQKNSPVIPLVSSSNNSAILSTHTALQKFYCTIHIFACYYLIMNRHCFLLVTASLLFLTENSFAQNKIGTGNNLVLVKGGTFLSTSDTKNPDDYTMHRETVEDFYISKYEVTVALYKSVTGKNPTSARDGTDEMKRPVENISGYDCIDFLNALSRLEGFEECYSFKNGKWTCD